MGVGFSDIDEVQYYARLFLALFVLIGIAPFLRKRINGFIDYLVSLRRPPAQGSSEYIYNLESSISDVSRLDGIDYIVFLQLAHAGDQGVTIKNLKQKLHLEPLLLTRVLLSLSKRELVKVTRRSRFNRRFFLSEKGKAYAVANGMILDSPSSVTLQSSSHRSVR